MHLTPHELDKLVLHQAGVLAQKRLVRGVRLNYPEAAALIATQVLEFIRDGRPVAELMDLGRQILGRADVMEGVPELLHEVQVEGTFPDGTKLVTVHHPIVAEQGIIELALYGSCLPVPTPEQLQERRRLSAPIGIEGRPGEVWCQTGEIVANAGRDAARLQVTNIGDRPIQVGSHYHFIETNRALVFDRTAAYGMRLDIPAGTAVRFEPGETKTITLVAIGGRKIIRGGNALADGEVNAANRARSTDQVRSRAFGHTEAAT